MCSNTRLESGDVTWNPITGCSKISTGCKNCYAERTIKSLQAMGQEKYEYGFDNIVCHFDALLKPLEWVMKRRIIVSSMGDLFHENVPDDYIKKCFLIMNYARKHTFQLQTKRSDRLLWMSEKLKWTHNIWMGVSVEDNDHTSRIDHLYRTGASMKFVSFEPLLGPVSSIDLLGIDWVIVGGELGPKSRPMMEDWVYDILTECQDYEIPLYFKQWGGTSNKKTSPWLNGRLLWEIPHPFTGKSRFKS